jgi:6-methylsalicylate decarboxylase
MAPFAATAVSRRELLAGSAALAIGTAAGFAPTVFAQAAPHRIDVHHHVSPPTWLDAVKSMKKDNPPMVSWSVQKSLDDMDEGGVATAITSPTTPQVIGLDKETAAQVAREFERVLQEAGERSQEPIWHVRHAAVPVRR